eukprot:365522-Chlamydomonas_euryale.AAC.10
MAHLHHRWKVFADAAAHACGLGVGNCSIAQVWAQAQVSCRPACMLAPGRQGCVPVAGHPKPSPSPALPCSRHKTKNKTKNTRWLQIGHPRACHPQGPYDTPRRATHRAHMTTLGMPPTGSI